MSEMSSRTKSRVLRTLDKLREQIAEQRDYTSRNKLVNPGEITRFRQLLRASQPATSILVSRCDLRDAKNLRKLSDKKKERAPRKVTAFANFVRTERARGNKADLKQLAVEWKEDASRQLAEKQRRKRIIKVDADEENEQKEPQPRNAPRKRKTMSAKPVVIRKSARLNPSRRSAKK
jgi:hypothetical protein